MLVQHFFPSSSIRTHTYSPFSSSSSSPSVSMQTKKTSIHSPFFNSESTGFQPTADQNIHMNCKENIKTHMSAWPRKLTSVMEIHRQRFSQLNQKFKQRPVVNHVQHAPPAHVILPQATRPQPRQQARTKQQLQTHFPPARRPNTAQQRNQPPPVTSDDQYITLANLTKILHVLQTQDKADDSDTSTERSSSTTNSAKQRVQQHLQATATRWWKPIRSSDSRSVPSAIHTSLTSNGPQQQPDDNNQLQGNLPLLTIVASSTRPLNIPSKYDESESSTEVQATTILTSSLLPSKAANIQRTRQEPLIMQARGMRVHSYDHRYYSTHNNMNFLQQQRLIRQT